MKKINSLEWGSKVIKILLLFFIGFPLILSILERLFRSEVFRYLRYVSLVGAAVILLVFCIVLFIEFKQDRYLADYYAKNAFAKAAIGSDLYECQSCNCSMVTEQDLTCPNCGIRFTHTTERLPEHRKWFLRQKL